MDKVTVSLKNEVFLRVDGEHHILQELSDHFSFRVPGAEFMPAFRHKLWDGNIKLFNLYTKEIYVGLLPHIKEFCQSQTYEVEDTCQFTHDNLDSLDTFIETLDIHLKDEKIEVRDYQQASVKCALENNRMLLLSPTGSGKSLVIYILMRWHAMRGRRVLIVVPTISLVEQMYTDFKDYHSKLASDWSVDAVTRVYSGKEKLDSQVVLSTWQSIYKLPKQWFQKFDVICGDEAHLFQSKSLKMLMEKTTTAKWKMGTTGTLDGTQTHRLVLEGLFGKVFTATTTKALMDTKDLADLKISIVQLTYPDEEKKVVKKFTYQEEMDWLVSHDRRNKFIRNLALKQQGNTLLLFQYVEKHGKILYDMIAEKVHDSRKVFFVHGEVEAKIREQIRAITEKETDAIIVASYGVFSVGINIRNLHNIIFASPSKSRIRNLQSIGRGLRTSETKAECRLFDIGDNLQWKSHQNYTLLHLIERVRLYAEEGFNYRMVTLAI